MNFVFVSGEVTCTSLHQHVGKASHNDVYPVSVDKLFQMIFTDTAFMTSVHEARRSYGRYSKSSSKPSFLKKKKKILIEIFLKSLRFPLIFNFKQSDQSKFEM